jgi:hypothetical protein
MIAVATAALATLGLVACDIRVETAVSPTPTADAATAARDRAARHEAAIVAAVGEPTVTGSGRAELAAIEALAAPAHLDVLGGVYEPFPDATESPKASATSDLHSAVTTARDDALDLAFDSSDSPAGFLAGSIGLSHAFALWHAGVVDARRAGVSVPIVAERALPGPYASALPIAPAASALSPQQLAELAVRHDQARFTYEVIAARETGARRTAALQRAQIHRERSDVLTSLAGIDDRTPVYELPQALIADEAARDEAARATEQGLGWLCMELTSGANSQDRQWLMSAAFDAYAASATLPGFVTAEFPVLPGVDPGSY